MAEPGHTFQSDNPIVQRLLAGTAPPPIKLAAARGALPISAEELVHVLFSLRDDPDPALRDALESTVAGLADETLAPLLHSASLPAAILDFFAHRAATKPHALAMIATNRAVADDTLEHLARTGPADVVELVVTNQVALIRAPRIIDGLLANAATTPDQRRRVLEVREEFFVKKEAEEKRRRDEEERLARIRAKKDWTHQELEKLQEELAAEALRDRESGTLTPDSEEKLAGEGDEEYQNATQRIMNMSVPEKILLALRGSRTERILLIRDANRLVATSVIKSPKVTDAEVEYYAGLRNIQDEILRIIGTRREWLRSYPVAHTLCRNPRTPLAVCINLLPRLQQKDLKNLAGDRNISETLRRQAKQLFDKMNQKGGATR